MSALEQAFMQSVDAFSMRERDLQPLVQPLQTWFAQLLHRVQASALDAQGLQAASPLAAQMQAINAQLQAGESRWAAQWDTLRPAQALAQSFERRAMLLVFGKFNAGKSSLCNFLAERFAAHGRSVRYFHLEKGQIILSEQRLREGATETTARLQGVCLGEQLVLLDTPGLHSGTDANAALTQRFLDSADGVLWLSSSTSPGQVQELDELAHELRRSKPLLPVLTRSDYMDEDEVDGALVKCLCNKTEAARALQEADVLARAQDKLVAMGLALPALKAPVSVSVLVARSQEQTALAMHEAGFERLYAALLAIIEPALAYKQRKPAEVLLHHLQEQVLGDLQMQTAPALHKLLQALQEHEAGLGERQMQVVQLAWREVIPQLPDLLDSLANATDLLGLYEAVNVRVDTALARQLNAQLGDYVLPAAAPADTRLEDATESMASAQTLGPERLYNVLEQAVRSALTERAAVAANACRSSLDRAQARVRALQAELDASAQALQGLAQALRA